MHLAIAGILCFFLPGIIGYGVICWLMPVRRWLTRLVRALLIAMVTTVLGAIGGYIFVYIRDPGPYHDGWHLNMAFTFGMLQFAVGWGLGLISLYSLSEWMKQDSSHHAPHDDQNARKQ